MKNYIDKIRKCAISEIKEKAKKNPKYLHPCNKERLEDMKKLEFKNGCEFTRWMQNNGIMKDRYIASLCVDGIQHKSWGEYARRTDKDQANKDGFESIKAWQNWKKYCEIINNIEYIKIYDKKEFNDKDKETFYRFWSSVDIKDSAEECWNWKLNIYDERGMFYYDKKRELAYRMAYKFTKGPIIGELQVQHLCNNGKCCNPNHLVLGTPAQNSEYMVNCNRQAKGEDNGFSKLTEDQVREIHKLNISHSELTQRQIAKKFKIARTTVTSILNGINWHDIYEEQYYIQTIKDEYKLCQIHQ